MTLQVFKTMLQSGLELTITTFGTMLMAGAEAHDYALVHEVMLDCVKLASVPCQDLAKLATAVRLLAC